MHHHLKEQLQFAPEPPVGAHFRPPPESSLNTSGEVDLEQLPLFVGANGNAEMSRTIRSVLATKPTPPKRHSYSLRENVPRVFKTEEMQRDEEVTEKEERNESDGRAVEGVGRLK